MSVVVGVKYSYSWLLIVIIRIVSRGYDGSYKRIKYNLFSQMQLKNFR